MHLLNNEIKTSENTILNGVLDKKITSIDSFTIDQKTNQVSGFIVLNQDIESITITDINNYLKEPENWWHMRHRLELAILLKVPLFLVSTNDQHEYKIFNIYLKNKEINIEQNNINLFTLFNKLRNDKIKNKKPLLYAKTASIQSILADDGIFVGGNLDGFKIDKDKILITEYTKRGDSQIDHDGSKTFNYQLSEFMNKDYGRWFALQLLKDQLNKIKTTELNIVVWSAHTDFVKLIKNVNFIGKRNPYLKYQFDSELKLEQKNKSELKIAIA